MSGRGGSDGHPPIDSGPGALSHALDLLVDRWTLLIVQSVFLRVRRYSPIMDRLRIAPSVLAERLQNCVDNELLHREPYAAGGRTRDEYWLTPRGNDLWMLLICLWQWEYTNIPGRRNDLPALMHLHCGQAITPEFGCRRCASGVHVREIEAVRRPDVLVRSTTGRRSGRATTDEPADPMLFREESMSMLGDSRTTSILVTAFLGAHRFSQFENESGARPAVVADRLERLISIGVLERSADNRREFRLTKKGRAFFPVLACLIEWTRRHLADDETMVIKLNHRACGQLLEPVLRCDHCHEMLRRYTVFFNLAEDSPLQLSR